MEWEELSDAPEALVRKRWNSMKRSVPDWRNLELNQIVRPSASIALLLLCRIRCCPLFHTGSVNPGELCFAQAAICTCFRAVGPAIDLNAFCELLLRSVFDMHVPMVVPARSCVVPCIAWLVACQ